ncbi:MAG: hypothetical protein ACREMZ_02825 [Gemmatimonadales bacterium]
MKPLMMQVKCLAHQADAGLIRFCVALAGVDLFFIAVFSVHRIYTALYTGNTPILGDQWHIGSDWSYAEMFGYLKTAIIISVLVSIRGYRQRPIYLALILIFTGALLDDALQVHERLGHGLADALALQSFAGRMSPHFGELIIWTILGLFLLAAAIVGFIRSPQQDRSNGLLLIGAFAVLVLFAVVVDLAHVLVKYEFRFRGADFLFTVMEEGGEQITLSLTCGLAVLVHRELRSRPRGGGKPLEVGAHASPTS